MQMKIVSIHNHGNSSKERVWLKVLEDCDLTYYAVADSTYTEDGGLSNKLRHFFWFPNHGVSKGDFVSLRTGKGTDKTFVNDNNDTVHRFHCGLDTSVWNDDGDIAVLIHTINWVTTPAK